MSAAAPERLAIAVPVEALPSAVTAAVVAPAAANPPAVPNVAPPSAPRRTPAPTYAFCNSSGLYSGKLIFSFLYPLNSGLFCILSMISGKSLETL